MLLPITYIIQNYTVFRRSLIPGFVWAEMPRGEQFLCYPKMTQQINSSVFTS